MDNKREINELRTRLLELGQKVVIPANEQKQTECDTDTQDIVIYPVWE